MLTCYVILSVALCSQCPLPKTRLVSHRVYLTSPPPGPLEQETLLDLGG